MLGLIVCFVTVIVFAWHRPYRDASDNTLQLLCQGAIFMALVSKVMLASPDVTGTQESATGVLLTVVVFVPPAGRMTRARASAVAGSRAACVLRRTPSARGSTAGLHVRGRR